MNFSEPNQAAVAKKPRPFDFRNDKESGVASSYLPSLNLVSNAEIIHCIQGALDADNTTAITELVNSITLDVLVSRSLLDEARWLKKWSVVAFLASLSDLPNEEKSYRKKLINAYLSIARREVSDDLRQRSQVNVLRIAVELIINEERFGGRRASSELPPKRVSGTDDEWSFTAELLLERGCFAIARNLVERCTSANMALWLQLASEFLKVIKSGRKPTSRAATSDVSATLKWIYQQLVTLSHKSGYNAPSLVKACKSLAMQIATLEAPLGNIKEVNRWIKLTDQQNPAMFAQSFMVRASALATAGHADSASLVLDELLSNILVDINDLGALRGKLTNKKHSDKAVIVRGGSEALADLLKTLGSVGHKPFLVSGTLLGFERGGGILAHDKDVDVGIIGQDAIPSIVATLLSSGRFTLRARYLLQEKIYSLPVWHTPTGVGIDIFIYHAVGDSLVTGVENEFGYLQKFKFSRFDVVPRRFGDLDVFVPSDVDRNLSENFGNWREPDESYISHLQSPSVCELGDDIYMLVVRLKILSGIVAESAVQIARAIDCGLTNCRTGRSLPQEISQHLSALISNTTSRS